MSEIEKLIGGLAASSGQNVVPFGKYRGQPLEVLRTDPEYTNWVLDNGVVSDTKYRSVYVFLTGQQQGGESHDTPEHNRYQVLFLDDGFAGDVYDRALLGEGKDWDTPRTNIKVEFEVSVYTDGLYMARKPMQGGRGSGPADVHITSHKTRTEVIHDYTSRRPPFEAYQARTTVRIEIKPSMGDDFPAVLRQMKASYCNVLYLVQYRGVGANLDQVKKLFGMSNITVLMHEEFWE